MSAEDAYCDLYRQACRDLEASRRDAIEFRAALERIAATDGWCACFHVSCLGDCAVGLARVVLARRALAKDGTG